MNRFSRVLVSGVGLCQGSVGCLAQTATVLHDSKSGPDNGLYSYASSTPATVMDPIRPDAPRPSAMAQGQLLLPANAAPQAKLAANVLVHGSGGMYQELFSYWVKLFDEQGYAVMVMDVFSPRGIKSSAKDQSQVPIAADTADG